MKKLLYTGVVLTLLLSACNYTVETEKETIVHQETVEVYPPDNTGFIHMVYLWLREDLTAEEKENIVLGMEELLKIESIYKGYYGPPAMTPREVVDNSYDFAFVVHFKSVEDHDLYQQDSIHLQFLADYKTYWDSIKIYDNLVNTAHAKY
jgi:hypothetical protein